MILSRINRCRSTINKVSGVLFIRIFIIFFWFFGLIWSVFLFHGAQALISGVRYAILDEVASSNACITRANGGLGFVRSYLTSIGAGKHGVSKAALQRAYLSEIDKLCANPRLRRFFCSQGSKKSSEDDNLRAVYFWFI